MNDCRSSCAPAGTLQELLQELLQEALQELPQELPREHFGKPYSCIVENHRPELLKIIVVDFGSHRVFFLGENRNLGC